MESVRFTHVSISANDLDESVRFYTGLFGMERIPSPDFDVPVEWLRCGDRQLHLFERDVDASEHHHLALHVDRFEEVYRVALERDLFEDYFDETTPAIYELPDGSIQTYIRDPSGNLIECNRPTDEGLSPEVSETIRRQSEVVPQSDEALRSSLYEAGDRGR